ncbi:hypothetical protein C2845_PM15G13820 [Panicum miliaceum]|uniref:Uncharacterized protein n=1 Tax=Panicum miliaceum TaxID=4540 RepID=A0A3L6Q7C0_PANMI|nr:hypothetical protein C2845_PM15G13820 [Panicum miliaceum]
MEPPSPFRRRWRGLLYRRSRAWRRWPAARQAGVASVPHSCSHARRLWPRCPAHAWGPLSAGLLYRCSRAWRRWPVTKDDSISEQGETPRVKVVEPPRPPPELRLETPQSSLGRKKPEKELLHGGPSMRGWAGRVLSPPSRGASRLLRGACRVCSPNRAGKGAQ